MPQREKERKEGAARSSVAVGYARQLDSDDAGLECQRRSIRSEAKRRGLSLAWSCDTTDRREALDRSGIARSLRLLRGERHTALIVADLTCLTRSLPVLSAILRRSAEEGWAIVSLGSPRIDTAHREGKVLQSVLSSYDALLDTEEDEASACATKADDPDRPSTRERIIWERIGGASLGQIANGLNRDGVAAPHTRDSWLPPAVWAELEVLRPGGD
jgi:Resolvase, N terminal domain